MLQASHEIWGVTIFAIMIGAWAIKILIRRKRSGKRDTLSGAIVNGPENDHDVEHRALMFLMNQKTEAMLAALARTIEQERQKLGGIVINPSMADPIDALQEDSTAAPDDHDPNYDQVLPMARQGMDVAAISRQLHLPEAEVSMVKRLKAA